jgi:DNA-binding transcriptional MerR regulator
MNYTVQAAARATGVSESRLRTWERRYGIPKPQRSPTGRRLYDEDDLALIRRMAALVETGIPAAQAAEAARTEGGLEAAAPVREAMDEAGVQLVTAASTFDRNGATGALREVVARLGWGEALDRAIYPALNEVGEAWRRGSITPAHEHFVSELIRRELSAAVAERRVESSDAPPVLLACVEDERHDLGLLGLALMLQDEGVPVVYLGADVPTGELLHAGASVAPAAICLSATAPNSVPMLAVGARAVITARLPVKLFVGGPALADPASSDVPGIRLPASTSEAAKQIAAAVSTS